MDSKNVTVGHSRGGLYAGASAGGGVAAVAGLAGDTNIGGGGGAAAYGHKTIHQQTQVIAEKTYEEAPKIVSQRTVQETPVVHRTVIEKTVIPQYVEKTIQVPSYVEKTIRVPTVVEHKVRVAVTPRIVEKTYDEGSSYQVGQHKPNFQGGLYAGAGFGTGYNGNAGGAVGGGGGYHAVKGIQASGGTYGYKSPTLFNDIFNIPISALGAVNNLLNGFAGARGSIAVSKQYGTY